MGGCGSSFIKTIFIFTNSFNQKNIFRQIFLFLFGFPSTPAVDQKFVRSFSSFWGFGFLPGGGVDDHHHHHGRACFALLG
jgi:hypothetical protein